MKKNLFSLMTAFAILCAVVAFSSFSGNDNTSLSSPQTSQAEWFDLNGNIGPYSIFMHINYMAGVGQKCGYYYYKSRPNTRYSLVMKRNESALAGSQMTLYEYTSRGYHSGTFKGYFSTRGVNFSGTFTNTTNGNKFKFELY